MMVPLIHLQRLYLILLIPKVKKYDNSNWESVGTLTEGTDYEIKYVDNTYGKKDSSGQRQYGVVLCNC